MKNLFFLFALCFLSSLKVYSQNLENHIYEDPDQYLYDAHSIIVEGNTPLAYFWGQHSSVISGIQEDLFTSWNIGINNALPTLWNKTQRYAEFNPTSTDSLYLLGTETAIGNSDSIALLLINVHTNGSINSMKPLRFDGNYLFRDMIFDGLNHYIICSDLEQSILFKINEQDSVLWSRKYSLSNQDLIFSNIQMDTDSTLLVYAEEFKNQESKDILLKIDLFGNIVYSKSLTEGGVANPEALQVYGEKVFTLSFGNYRSSFALNVIDPIDSLSKVFTSYIEYSANEYSSLEFIMINDSMVYFTSGIQLFELNYLSFEFNVYDSYLDIIETNYQDSTEIYYLYSKVGRFPVLSFSDVQSIGIHKGIDLELFGISINEDCFWGGYSNLEITDYFDENRSLQSDTVVSENIENPITIDFDPLKEKKGCLDPGSSVFSEQLEASISVSPNPSSGTFEVFNRKGNIDGLTIYNNYGQQLLMQDGSGQELHIVNLNLDPGIYFMVIESDERFVTKQLVIF